MPTLGEALNQVREMEARVAVKRGLLNFLRMRYIGRDSADALAQFRVADGSPAPQAVVELEAQSIEEEIAELERAVRAAKTVEVDRG